MSVTKIGSSVLHKQTEEKSMLRLNTLPLYVESVLSVLENAKTPLTIREIQERTGIRQWNTTKKIINGLLERGYVEIHHQDKKSAYFVLKR